MTQELSGELKAMVTIEAALKDLPDDERARVMQWAASRFRGSSKTAPRVELDGGGTGTADLGQHGSLADLYDAAAPQTETDRALVAAYWFQVQGGADDVEAQKVNTELKHLGHGVSNITRAFDDLKSQRPALVIQTRKEGTTKQARKKYKVTNEGKKAIERMLARDTQ